jgi:hypothetical protein
MRGGFYAAVRHLDRADARHSAICMQHVPPAPRRPTAEHSAPACAAGVAALAIPVANGRPGLAEESVCIYDNGCGSRPRRL